MFASGAAAKARATCQADSPCAIAGCRSRSSRPNSSATTRSPTICRRARWPTGGSRTSGSSSSPVAAGRSTSCCSAMATISAIPTCATRSRPAASACAPTTSSSRPAPRRRCSRPPPPCSSRAITRSSYGPTTRPTSRPRARSAPSSTSSTSISTTAGDSTSSALAALVRPGVTRLISVTCPHNPTGTMLDARVAARARRVGRALGRGPPRRRDLPRPHARLAAADRGHALTPRDQRLVDVEGVRATRAPDRLGGLPRPALAETLLAAKEQIVICGATIDEAIAGRVLADTARILPPILDDVRAASGSSASGWRDQRDVRVDRTGGRGRRPRPLHGRGRASTPRRSTSGCSSTHGTYVGPGHWFEVDDRHFRLGFGWPTETELRAGLAALSAAADDSAPCA